MKAFTAAAVAMILFFMSSAAVACDLSCSLLPFRAHCAVAAGAHSAIASSAQSAPADMPGMDMGAPMERSATAATAMQHDPAMAASAVLLADAPFSAHAPASPCVRNTCAQDSTSATLKVSPDRMHAAALLLVDLLAFGRAPRTRFAEQRMESPPSIFGPIDSLTVSLRI